MADKKISELPLIQTISGSTVVVPLVHDGTTIQMSVQRLSLFTSQFSATTASNTFIGNQIISGNISVNGTSTFTGNTSVGGNLIVNGKLTAQEIYTEITSASIIFESGSTKFGDDTGDKHQFTGSINVSGSVIYNGVILTNIDANTIQRLQQATSSLNIQTGSQDNLNAQIGIATSSLNFTSGSLNTQTGSQGNLNAQIGIATGSLNSFTGSFNLISGSYATTGSNTFIGNQRITGSLSVSAGEFNVTTGSGNMTSSLIFDHTQNDGVTLGLRHNDRLSVADHTFNVNVWAAGVYTTFVRNGAPYSILNVEAFDDNKIYLYRDTRLYNKSLVIDNNLTVQKGIVIGSGSLSIPRGQFNAITGSGALTSSLSFTHTEVDPITGDATLELRYKNNQVGPENNAWKFVATDNGVQVRYDQLSTSNKTLFTLSSFGSNFDKLLIWRDTRLYGMGLTVDESLLVKGVITGSLLATNGVISSSNQLFELNQQTGSQSNLNVQIGIATASLNFTSGALNLFTGSIIGQANTISAFTSSINAFTGSQIGKDGILAILTSSIDAHILKQATQTGSQDLVNLGISSITGSLIGITNTLMGFTASLDNTYATDAQLYQLYQATASIQFTTASLNTQTGSQSNLNAQIGIATSSLNSVSASLIGITNGLMAFTAALDSTYATDAQLYQLYQATRSIELTTGSLIGITNGLMALTASMKGQAIVSSSTQITNYYKFAETASANTFYGDQTITGSLAINDSTTNFLIEGNAFSQTYLTANGALVLNPGFGGVEMVGSYRTFKATDITADGFVSGEIRATNNVVSSSAQITELTQIGPIEAYTASLKGAIEVSGQDVNVLGMITAQQFNVTYVSSSVMYRSGSTEFGDSSDDSHLFTGSLIVSGTLAAGTDETGWGRISFNESTNTLRIQSSKNGTQCTPISFWSQRDGGTFAESMAISGSYVSINRLAASANYKLGVSGSAYINGANDKGIFVTDNATFASIVGLNSAISAYNPLELRASGTDYQLYLPTTGEVLMGTNTVGAQNSGAITFRTTTATYGGVMIMNHSTTNNTSAGYIDCFYNTSYIGGIAQNGASNVAFNTSSDYRLKEDLKDFGGLNLISNLKVYDFKWKTDNSRMYGVLAHELQEIIPYVVNGNKDEVKEDGKIKVQVVDYSKIVPILIKSIQEQQTIIDGLLARIEALENK